MNYEEFLDKPTTFMDDMLKLINIKHKYRLRIYSTRKRNKPTYYDIWGRNENKCIENSI